MRPDQRNRLLFGLFAAVIVCMVLRGQSDSIVLREFINPDEGDLLAGGRRAALSLIPFKDFTSFTYGPLWPFTLGWLHRLGMPLTLPVAHLLNAAIISTCCVALAYAVWKRWNLAYSIVVVTPLALHWTKGFYSADFYSLSTESLGLFWLTAACIVSFPRGAITARRALIGAVLLGCAVWSKYSFVPVVAVALAALGVNMVHSGIPLARSVKTCLLAPFAPYGFLASWALVMGVPSWKIVETISITLRYLRAGGLEETRPTLGDRFSETWNAMSMFRSIVPLAVLLVVTVVVGAYTAGYRRLSALDRDSLVPQLIRLLAVGAVLAGIASLMVFVPIYPHYTNLFVAGFILSTFLVASLPATVHELRTASTGRVLLAVTAVTAWAIPPVIARGELMMYRWSRGDEAKTNFSRAFTTDGGLWDRISTADARPLSQSCPRGSRVFVWGWAPDLYSQYDWIPATRYVITTNQMVGPTFNGDIAEYRPRLLADIRRHLPDCIVDGTGVAFFPSWGQENSLARQWPELVAELMPNYTQIAARVNGESPLTVWIRNR